MVTSLYIPQRGDIVWIDFNPTKGREQSKRRPAIVISPESYNRKTQLALVCPITSTSKGYPFEVEVRTEHVSGVILSDHVRSVDWKERNVTLIKKTSDQTITMVQKKLTVIIHE